MKFYTLTAVMAVLLTAHAAPATAADTLLRYAPLTPMSACLDPDRIRTWHFIDSDEVLIDAGRKHFLLQLSVSCPELTHAWQIGFKAGNSVSRICGNLGDQILGTDRHMTHVPCRIASVRPLDQAQYDAELRRERTGKRGVVRVRGEADSKAKADAGDDDAEQ